MVVKTMEEKEGLFIVIMYKERNSENVKKQTIVQ